MEELLTIQKNLRDKHVTLMNEYIWRYTGPSID